MTRNRVWIALVVCFVLSFANLLFAASPASSNSDALLDVLSTLQQKGVLSQQEYNQLKNRVQEEQAKQATAPQFQTVAMQETGMEHGANVVSAMSSGVGFHTGRFDIAFDGEVNGFLVHSRPDTSSGLACALCLIDQSPRTNNAVRSGLLPSKLGIKISTEEHGWNVAVYFGIWPAIQNSNYGSVETGIGTTTALFDANGNPNGNIQLPGSSLAGGSPGIDFRQNFATLSHKNFGTLLIGRNLGLFGQEAILNDMTLFGAGSTNGNNQFPNNVTFGRIGVGYVYTDFLPQITYTTPSFNGLQGSIGIMQPYDDPIWGLLNGGLDAHTQPMIQGKLTYSMKKTHGVGAKFWGNFMTQKETNVGGNGTLPVGGGVRATGVDYGANISYHGLTLVGYGYNGWGLGTTALLFGGIGVNTANTQPIARPSQGWYGQLTYNTGKHTFGMSYGQSNLSPDNPTDLALATLGGVLVRNNTAYMGQYRYNVTSWDALVAEYTHATAKNQAGVKGNSDSIALGTIVFF